MLRLKICSDLQKYILIHVQDSLMLLADYLPSDIALYGATKEQIKRAYKKLSLKYHPDKATGDHKKFMKIAKAYTA